MADDRDSRPSGDQDEEAALGPLEEIIIDLRDCLVRPASADVAVVHLTQMEAASRDRDA